ncbi:MAG: DNA repair protein RecO [Steroidobacteraceae bacterium]
MQRVEHTPAFLLHQRPWGDSGRIFELFSRQHGRLSVFARGVRGANARLAGVLQPFMPLLVSWAGRGESPRLTGAEFDTGAVATGPIPQERLMPAWYLSELVMSLTARHDPQPELYDHYRAAISDLRAAPDLARTLRLFEKRLLDVLGYGITDLRDARFDDPEEVERIRPQLRQALASCLEGRSLRTRVVAQSLRDFGRANRQAE